LYNKSRMRGDFQVRFCERLGLQRPCLLDPQTLGGILKQENMRHSLLGIIALLLCCCINSKNNFSTKTELKIDTIAIDLNPNQYNKTIQYINGDILNGKTAKEEFYFDTLLIKEVYKNYMTSEYDGYGDGEYQYFYNKDKKLIIKYYIESPSGDSTKYIFKYFSNRDCEVTVYDFRKRLKSNMPHGDEIGPEDFNEYRTWFYKCKWINSFDENNKLIKHYEIKKNPSRTSQNLYIYKYQDNKLIVAKSFLNDSVLYWSEKYEYSHIEIKMIHNNVPDKDNSWILPYYYEKTKLDNHGNDTLIEKYDDKKNMMRRYLKKYDSKNRLIRLECFNEKNILKLKHIIVYEMIK